LPEIETIEITDRERWNGLVLALPNCELRQGFGWGEIQREAGSIPYRFAVMRGDRCIAALQLLAKKVRRLNCVVLDGPRGPLLDWKDRGAWDGLMTAIKRVADQTGAVFLRTSPLAPTGDSDAREALLDHGFVHLAENFTAWNVPRLIQTLDIRPTEEELKSRMRKTIRQDLEAARKRGAVIEALNSVEALRRLHRLMVTLQQQKGYPAVPFAWLLCEHREYYAPEKGVVWIISHEGEDLAASTSVQFGRVAYQLHLALERGPKARSFRPGHALDWEAVRWAKARGCEELNLGGSGIRRFPPDREDPGFGVYEYKRGFRASLNCLTGYYDLVFQPMRYRLFRFAERVQPLWDRLQERVDHARSGRHDGADTDRRELKSTPAPSNPPLAASAGASRNGHEAISDDTHA
jgi:peptidoglycan pentaglycine glycine transferase (the first glycine)